MTTMNIQPAEETQARARFALEYRANPDVFSTMNISEADYITSRLRDEGRMAVDYGIWSDSSTDPGKAANANVNADAYKRVPGMISMTPGKNEVGSTDDSIAN